MEPTTLRLPDETLSELDSEYSDYGYPSRSDYIRAIIEHREPPYENTTTTSDYDRPTTDDYERLRERVAELEERIDDLDGGPSLNQQSGVEQPDPLVKDEGREMPPPPSEPQGLDATEQALDWVREHQPVERAEIIERFGPIVEEEEPIQPNSWYDHHLKDALRDAGASFRRNVGWSFEFE